MKKVNLVIIMLALSVMAATNGCQGQTSSNTNKNSNTQQDNQETVKPVIEHLTAATFKQKVFDYDKNKTWMYAGDKPCIIDFYANWCGPCRILAPTVEQIAKEYQGKIYVYKVNVDEQRELASTFGISGIPALLFCPQTDKPQISTGVISKADFDKAIKEVLNIRL
jgi:thioredoxin